MKYFKSLNKSTKILLSFSFIITVILVIISVFSMTKDSIEDLSEDKLSIGTDYLYCDCYKYSFEFEIYNGKISDYIEGIDTYYNSNELDKVLYCSGHVNDDMSIYKCCKSSVLNDRPVLFTLYETQEGIYGDIESFLSGRGVSNYQYSLVSKTYYGTPYMYIQGKSYNMLSSLKENIANIYEQASENNLKISKKGKYLGVIGEIIVNTKQDEINVEMYVSEDSQKMRIRLYTEDYSLKIDLAACLEKHKPIEFGQCPTYEDIVDLLN